MNNELSEQELKILADLAGDTDYQLDRLGITIDIYLSTAHVALNDALEAMEGYTELIGKCDEDRVRSLESLLIILEAEMNRYMPKDEGRSLEDLS